jgi:hypothetical protein
MVQATESVGVADLRSSRRALRAELARVSRWRRLTCARLDLAVSSAIPPEVLGLDPALLLSGVLRSTPPSQADLARALPLRQLDDELACYQRDLDTTLAAITEQYIAHLIVDPAAALDDLRTARRRR